MRTDLVIPCSALEDMLCAKYRLEETAKLTSLEFDELSDVVALSFDVADYDLNKIDHEWDDDQLAYALIEEAI